MANPGGEGIDLLLETLLDVRTIFDPASTLTSTLRAALAGDGRASAVAWVALPEDDGGLVIEHVLGQRTPALERLDVGQGQGLTGKVFERASVHWVDDYTGADTITHEFDAIIESERIRRMIAAPLTVHDTVLGVLSVGRRDAGDFADRTIDDVVNLARQASTALGIARETRAMSAAAALAERRRVSEELHDGVGALMFSLLSRADRLERRSASTYLTDDVHEIQRELGEVSSLVRALVSEWHESASTDLRSELLDVVEDFERRSGIGASLVFLGSVPALDAARIQALTRFVGVALSNVERHASARRVSVTASGLPGHVSVAVSNDGPSPDRVVPGVGLGGAEARIARLGGTLTHIGDEDDGGFTVRARIPLP